jgi:hypothetical protein
MALETIELEGGWQVTVDYDYDPGQSGGHWDEEPIDPSVNINNIWAVFSDSNDKLIQVDVFRFLVETDLVDEEEVQSTILETISNYEPDPDRDRL